MLKRIMFLTIVISTFVLLALVPMTVSAVSDKLPKAQATVVVPPVTVVSPGETPASSIPVTGGYPMSTLIIFALLGLLALGIIIGGMALINRRQ